MGLVKEALSDHMVVKLVFGVISGPREKIGICSSVSVIQILETELQILTIGQIVWGSRRYA
jgi:hypothetical protein